MKQRFCEIKVHDGEELLFERQVPVGQIGDRRLVDLLQALVVKYALTPEKIVDGHLNRNARGYRPLPEVRQDGGCSGSNCCAAMASTPWPGWWSARRRAGRRSGTAE